MSICDARRAMCMPAGLCLAGSAMSNQQGGRARWPCNDISAGCVKLADSECRVFPLASCVDCKILAPVCCSCTCVKERRASVNRRFMMAAK
jgi:hypothetical protein